jgi:hypothetical protein
MGGLLSQHTLVDKGALGRQVELDVLGINDLADYDTGLDEPTLVLLMNEPDQSDPRRGRSDYTIDAVELQKQFSEKLSVLLRHFRELVNGGILQLPIEAQSMAVRRSPKNAVRKPSDFGRNAEAGRDQIAISPDELEAIFTDGSNSDSVKFHARTPQYEGGLRSLQLVLAAFERVTGCTLDSVIEQAAAPESGRAMRMSRIRDRKRVLRKHQRYARPLAHIYELALAMMGVAARVSYEFPDPFPMGEDERAELANIRVGGPTLSLESALERYFDHTAEEAEAEAERIKSAQHEAGANVGIGLFGQQGATPDEFEDEEA